MTIKKRYMQLGEWLDSAEISQAVFSDRSGLPQSAVSRLVNGGEVKTSHWARVMQATDGLVRPEAYHPEELES